MFEQLSNEFDSVQFIKIDIDENEDTAVQYKITSVPTFVFLKGDKVVTQVSRFHLVITFLMSFYFFLSSLFVIQFSGANADALKTNLQELSGNKPAAVK
jgi:thiol-disulfide isomerase/thioredoxin